MSFLPKTPSLWKILPVIVRVSNDGKFLPCVLKVWSTDSSLHQCGLCIRWLGSRTDPRSRTPDAASPTCRGPHGSRRVPSHGVPCVGRAASAKWKNFVLRIVQKTAWKITAGAHLQWKLKLFCGFWPLAFHGVWVPGKQCAWPAVHTEIVRTRLGQPIKIARNWKSHSKKCWA